MTTTPKTKLKTLHKQQEFLKDLKYVGNHYPRTFLANYLSKKNILTRDTIVDQDTYMRFGYLIWRAVLRASLILSLILKEIY